jgi:arginyl-tRNA synthetase
LVWLRDFWRSGGARFYCPALKAETEEFHTSRPRLCDLTARTLQRGLNLLGIETVERM